MKKCTHCGCYNQDSRMKCADCDRSLAGAEKVSEAELDEKLEKASRYSDPFSFKPRHQIVFYASLALIAVSILLANLSLIHPALAFTAVFCLIICLPFARFPETMWNIEKFFMQFKVSGEVEPSDWWFISREILMFLLFGMGIGTVLYALAENG